MATRKKTSTGSGGTRGKATKKATSSARKSAKSAARNVKKASPTRSAATAGKKIAKKAATKPKSAAKKTSKAQAAIKATSTPKAQKAAIKKVVSGTSRSMTATKNVAKRATRENMKTISPSASNSNVMRVGMAKAERKAVKPAQATKRSVSTGAPVTRSALKKQPLKKEVGAYAVKKKKPLY